MTRFSACLSFVLQCEGGFVNDPADRGGATNYGITQRTYSAWLDEHGYPDKDIRQISSNEVAALYQEKYWLPSGAHECPAPLDLLVFDCAVNSGVGRAVRTIQRVVGVDDDGVFGPATRAAVHACDPHAAAAEFLAARSDFYHAIVTRDSTQAKFLRGWLNRVAALEQATQEIHA